MNQIDIYNQVFIKTFRVNSDQLDTLSYRSISAWDSIGHMVLIAEMEEVFNILIDANDIIDFSSYEKGKQILNKYNVSF
jgi:acyl carrier protein